MGDHMILSSATILTPTSRAAYCATARSKADGLDEVANMMQEGYFIQLLALRKFYFKHGKETVLVRPGFDIATHVNLVSSFPING